MSILFLSFKLMLKVKYSNLLYIKYLSLIAFLILIANSCNLENCYQASGTEKTEIRQVPNFNEIEINDVFDVYLQQDSINAIKITCGKNLIPQISTIVSDQKLSLSNKNICNWARSFKNRIKVTISFVSIDYLLLNGECNIFTKDTLHGNIIIIDNFSSVSKMQLSLNYDTIHFSLHSGTGDFILNGNTDIAYYYIYGTGYLFSEELVCSKIFITNGSTGDCYINATNSLFVSIIGNGDIFYKGEPEINFGEMNSKGRLIKILD